MFNTGGILYPDSVVGTDSHTTMINGLGILGWGNLLEHCYCLGHKLARGCCQVAS